MHQCEQQIRPLHRIRPRPEPALAEAHPGGEWSHTNRVHRSRTLGADQVVAAHLPQPGHERSSLPRDLAPALPLQLLLARLELRQPLDKPARHPAVAGFGAGLTAEVLGEERMNLPGAVGAIGGVHPGDQRQLPRRANEPGERGRIEAGQGFAQRAADPRGRSMRERRERRKEDVGVQPAAIEVAAEMVEGQRERPAEIGPDGVAPEELVRGVLRVEVERRRAEQVEEGVDGMVPLAQVAGGEVQRQREVAELRGEAAIRGALGGVAGGAELGFELLDRGRGVERGERNGLPAGSPPELLKPAGHHERAAAQGGGELDHGLGGDLRVDVLDVHQGERGEQAIADAVPGDANAGIVREAAEQGRGEPIRGDVRREIAGGEGEADRTAGILGGVLGSEPVGEVGFADTRHPLDGDDGDRGWHPGAGEQRGLEGAELGAPADEDAGRAARRGRDRGRGEPPRQTALRCATI